MVQRALPREAWVAAAALFFCAALSPIPFAAAQPASNATTYEANLRFVKEQMLPAAWKLQAVMKWDAYGHGLRELAPAAKAAADSIGVLWNWEAAEVAAAVDSPNLMRITPAGYGDIVEAARAGYDMSELVGPGNLEDAARAAADANTTINVHLYLGMHYGDPWGWNFTTAKQLQKLVDTLPDGLALEGVMMHINGQPEEDKDGLVRRFFKVTCPLAKRLDKKGRRLQLHWADSSEVLRLVPESKLRMRMPKEACDAPNVDYYARVGYVAYGSDKDANEIAASAAGGTKPVMTWSAPVASVAADERGRRIATVALGADGGRYPSPGWWHSVEAYFVGSLDNKTGDPAATVYIGRQPFRLAGIPSDGRTLTVDVSKAKTPVTAADTVCLLCEQHTLYSMAEEVGTDDYNLALCLRGVPAVEGTQYNPPSCLI